MADFDKESIMNMINSLIGEANAKKEGFSDTNNDNGSVSDNNIPFFSGNSDNSANSDFYNTAEIMSRMTGIIDKLNRTKNNREFMLLSAVRPYMRSSRRGKIDTCMKLLQVVNVVNEMKKES